MRVLVTGGAGYIGSVLVPMLLADSHQVTVLDSFMYRQISLLDCCWDRNLQIVRGDVRDHTLLKEWLAWADVILPLACLTGAPICADRPDEARAVNRDAVKTISAMTSGSQMLIFPSSNSGYGVGEHGSHCTEESPLNPVSLYGKLKVELERSLLDTGECVTFRFATAFGVSPRMRLDLLVNDFTYRAVVDGALVLYEPGFRRNYLHVRDAARAFIHAMANYEAMKGKPHNVGLSEANLTKEELCQVIKRSVPEFNYVVSEFGTDPDKRDYVVSNERIESTGYRTRHSLRDGVDELIRSFAVIRDVGYRNS